MRIRSLDISAYGALVGRRFDLGEGLTVAFGRNEAGKTTLKRFIETMLFGFEDDDIERFDPWRSDGHDFGGQLAYELADGRSFLVRRHCDASANRKRDRESASVMSGLDGAGGEADVAPDKLASSHVQQRRTIFRTVFSIDLNALIALRDLADDEQEAVARVFFRELATLGALANPTEVSAGIRERAERICNFGGSRKRKLVETTLKKAISDARSELRGAKAAAEEARRLRDRLEDLQGQRSQRIEARAKLQADLSRLQDVGPAAQSYRRLAEARAALEQLGDAAGVDDEVLGALDRRLLERQAIRIDLEQRREEREAANRQVSTLRDQLEELAVVEAEAGEIRRLSGLCDEAERLSKELAGKRDDLAFREGCLAAEIAEIATGDDPLSCAALESTSTRRNDVTGRIEACAELAEEVASLKQRLAEFRDRAGRLDAQIEQALRRLPEDFPEDFRPDALRSLQGLQQDCQRIEVDRRALEARREQLKLDRQNLEAVRREPIRGRAAPAMSQWVAWIAAVIVGLGAVAYFGYSGALAGALFGGAIVLVGAWQLVGLMRGLETPADDVPGPSPVVQSLVDQIKSGEDYLEREGPSLDELRRRVVERFAAAGLGPEPDARRLADEVRRLQSYQDALADHQRLTDLRQDREALSTELESLGVGVGDTEERLAASRRGIEQVFSEMGLRVPEDWTPRQLRDRLDLTVRAGDRLIDCRQDREGLARLEGRRERFLADVRSLGEKVPGLVEEGPAAADSVAGAIGQVRALAERLDHVKSLRQRLTILEDEADTAAKRLTKSQDRVAEVDREVGEALRKLGLETAEALPAFKQRVSQRRDLATRVRLLIEEYDRLRMAASLPEDWTPPQEGSEGADEAPSDEGPEQLRARLATLEDEIDQLGEESHQLKQALVEQEGATPVAVAEGAYEAALDELAAAYEQFDALLVAHRLLERTMQRYQQQRQPSIVRGAQAYLKELTAGRYDTMQTDLLDRSQKLGEIYLVPPSGRPRDAKFFSRGAREQVYLALRIALADELSPNEPVPLILDDVLVNFDDPRFRATVDLLVGLSERRQLLFLTCHEDIRDALAGRGATLVEL
ncbi:MAG: AAA family ATPase [Phycisphaerae bacterium]|nr:AAA family ATPase [Phycisphaerae bacterium]